MLHRGLMSGSENSVKQGQSVISQGLVTSKPCPTVQKDNDNAEETCSHDSSRQLEVQKPQSTPLLPAPKLGDGCMKTLGLFLVWNDFTSCVLLPKVSVCTRQLFVSDLTNKNNKAEHEINSVVGD